MVDNGIPIIVAIRFDTGHQKMDCGIAKKWTQFTGENGVLNDVTITSLLCPAPIG